MIHENMFLVKKVKIIENAKKQDSADRKARSIIILADEFCGRFERIAYYKRNMEQKIIT